MRDVGYPDAIYVDLGYNKNNRIRGIRMHVIGDARGVRCFPFCVFRRVQCNRIACGGEGKGGTRKSLEEMDRVGGIALGEFEADGVPAETGKLGQRRQSVS